MRRFRSAVIGLVTLWLPLQGFAAVAMPFCSHALQSPAPQSIGATIALQAGDANGHHHGAAGAHHSDVSAHGVKAQHHASGFACNDCGACQLACAPMLSGSARLGADSASFDFLSFPAWPPRVFTPEQPNPPPLA
jgi:hypothetical protein